MTTGIGWIANVYQNAHLRYAYLYLCNLFIQVALLAMFVHLRLIIIPQTYVVHELLRKFSLILWPFELDSVIFIVNYVIVLVFFWFFMNTAKKTNTLGIMH